MEMFKLGYKDAIKGVSYEFHRIIPVSKYAVCVENSLNDDR